MERVAELLNLPGVRAWKPRNKVLAIVCDGFEISVHTSGRTQASIIMSDTKVDIGRTVQEREEVQKEKARRAFKP